MTGALANLEILPGDVFLTRSPTWLGRAIRAMTRSKDEPPTRVNHVGMFVSAARLRGATSIEALWHVRIGRFWRYYAGNSSKVAIYRHPDLDYDVRLAIADDAMRAAGSRYATWKIAFHAVGLGGLLRYGGRVICSSLVGGSYARRAGYRFRGKRGQTITPDDIDDDVRGTGWVRVLPLQRIGRG